MNRKRKKLLKTFVSFVLVIVLSMQSIIYAYASSNPVTPASSAIITKDGTFEITKDVVIIDGIYFSKAQIKQAVQQMQQLPDTPERTAIYNSMGVSTRSGGALALAFEGIGLGGLVGVFAQIAFALAMATLVVYCANRVDVLTKEHLPGLTRDIHIAIKDAQSVYIDGVRVGLNWLTQDITNTIDTKQDNIGEVPLNWDMFMGSWEEYEAYGVYASNNDWVTQNLHKQVKDILKSKMGSIKNAPKKKGDPSWDTIYLMTLEEIQKRMNEGDAGYGRVYKLLTDHRFDR